MMMINVAAVYRPKIVYIYIYFITYEKNKKETGALSVIFAAQLMLFHDNIFNY